MAMADTHLLTQQLRRLDVHHPVFAQAIAQASSDTVHVEATRNGEWTATIEANGPCLVHSKYDPGQEAAQFCRAQLQSNRLTVALIGVGLGYHAQFLHSFISPNVPLLLFEPDYGLIQQAFAHRDLSGLLRAGNVVWFGDEPGPRIMDRLMSLASHLAQGVQIVIPPVSHRRIPQYVAMVQSCLDNAAEYAKALRETRRKQGRIEVTNLIRNIERYASAESLESFRDCVKGGPAVMVAAGPSLTRNADLLAEAMGKIPIIAVGAALRSLLARGITPDVCVHIDYSELCARQFQDIEVPAETLLVAGVTAAPAPFEYWQGRLAMTFHPFAKHLLADFAPAQPEFPQATSVAHCAFYTAQFFGADPIILVGLDLAFTDGTYYSAGNALHELWRPELNRFCSLETKEWERLVRRRQALVQVADWNGRPLYTDKPMAMYLQQFERDFARTEVKVIDATQGGARKEGAIPMRLADALTRFPATHQPPFFPPTPAVHKGHQCRAQIRKAAQRFREFSRTMNAISDVQRELLDKKLRPQRQDRLFRKLDELQQTVGQRFEGEYQITATFAPEIEFAKEAQAAQIESQSLAQEQMLRALLQRDLQYTSDLARASMEIFGLLNG